jgi:hypothetical protein
MIYSVLAKFVKKYFNNHICRTVHFSNNFCTHEVIYSDNIAYEYVHLIIISFDQNFLILLLENLYVQIVLLISID